MKACGIYVADVKEEEERIKKVGSRDVRQDVIPTFDVFDHLTISMIVDNQYQHECYTSTSYCTKQQPYIFILAFYGA